MILQGGTSFAGQCMSVAAVRCSIL